MILAAHFTFYAGIALYVLAAVLAVRFAGNAAQPTLRYSRRIVAAGALLLAATFVLRWVQWDHLPLTTTMDILNLFVVLSSIVMLVILRGEGSIALQCFYLPPLALMCLLSGIAASSNLHMEPRALTQNLVLAVHVGLVFLAYSMFFVASLTSVAYVFKVQQLKRQRSTPLFSKLPALERLDQSLFLLIRFGYPIFVVTLLVGIVWAWKNPELLGARWWLSPKIILSPVMAAFYAVSFHTRRFGLLRGRQLAYFVFWGFTVILMTLLFLRLLNLIDYNFWGAAA